MQLAAGSRLSNYEIIAPLGAGGMGEVYRARDPVLKRDVAIKVLPESWSRDQERLRRFRLEAQATAALNHPNIISIFQVGEHDGYPYIVTELLQGETLRDRLRRGPVRPREACDYGIAIALGIAAAHDSDIVHRDLKPENLFLLQSGGLKILDFGLARVTEPVDNDGTTRSIQWHTKPGQVAGTVGYMAPEQVRGLPADARSDIFAFGLVLYEMLTGQRAFRKATSAETLSAILNDDPPPLSQFVQDIPPALQRILSRCLEKKPERRFQNASDLAFALEALSDASDTALSAPLKSGTPRWLVWTSASILSVAIAAALFVWWRQPPAVAVIEAVNQITSDGEIKANGGRLVTDGSRIYFSEGTVGSYRIMEVAAVGGPTSIIHTRLPNFQFTALSQDGSYLLGGAGDAFMLPFWAVPLPSGEPRLLGSIVSQDADLFPDGRILYCLGNEIYIAEKDGSSPHKLITVNGLPVEPSVSPDGQRIVFTLWTPSHRAISIDVVKADGSGLEALLQSSAAARLCCARWSADGRYIIYSSRHEGRSDIWALAMQSGFLRRSRSPIQLTNGPLSYRSPISSRDGKQVFAVGTVPRGELVHYDADSRQFLPLLPGVHAFSPSWSADGQWVAYTTYPDHVLWRSRTNGTDPLQLTFPPGQVYAPSISPSGKQVAYVNSAGEICLIEMNGGSPPTVVAKDGTWPQWSPDGIHLLYKDRAGSAQIHIRDLDTGRDSVIPASADMWNAVWVGTNRLVAATHDSTKLRVFDLTTQQWSDLVSFTEPGYVVNWAPTPDNKSLDYVTAGPEPMLLRVRLADRRIETITNLKALHRATGPSGNTVMGVAPDGSAVFSRDIGSQEIYSLNLKWP
jgi:serine/threonine protein kinase/Tol biopolymer transport system component